MTPATILGALCIAGALVTFFAIVGAHFVATDKNPVRDPVSDYGAGPHRIWYWGGLAGVSLAALALIVAATGGLRPASPVAVAFLAVFVAARVAIAFYPTDVAGSARTATGRVHGLLAFAAFASIGVAAGTYGSVSPWFGWSLNAALALLVICLVWRTGRPVFGLVERVFYAAMIAWFVAAGVALIN